MTLSCRGFGVLSLRKKNSPGKKRVAWIIYPPYRSRSAGKAAPAQTLNHDWFHSLTLRWWLCSVAGSPLPKSWALAKTLQWRFQCLCSFSTTREAQTTWNLKQRHLSGVCGWPCALQGIVISVYDSKPVVNCSKTFSPPWALNLKDEAEMLCVFKETSSVLDTFIMEAFNKMFYTLHPKNRAFHYPDHCLALLALNQHLSFPLEVITIKLPGWAASRDKAWRDWLSHSLPPTHWM